MSSVPKARGSSPIRAGWTFPIPRHRFLVALALLLAAIPSQAQWLTAAFDLKPGWNAIFTHVDASHTTLNQTIAGDPTNPILEVWRWNPLSTVQFAESTQQPFDNATDWTSWSRTDTNSPLQRLTGDSAYLVRVATNVGVYRWQVKGRPVPPRYDWNSAGVNLVGFSTVTNAPPNLEAFVAFSPDLQQNGQLFQYNGGELSSNNPARVFALRTTPVKRGQAFWVRSGAVFNKYFGPFEVVVSSSSGFDFREDVSTHRLRLRNLTGNSLVVTARLGASETPPAGQTNIAGVPSLLVRGELNLTNLTYGYTNLPLNAGRSWTLAPKDQPGSEVEVVLGLNRTAMTGNPGDLLAGIVRFTDSFNHLQIEVPVAARISSSAGLWIGAASVSQVQHYLKAYERDAGSRPLVASNGQYVVTNVNTSLGEVARPYPLRLIVHNPAGSGNAVLLQRAYYGMGAGTNPILANSELLLAPQFLSEARRISATHLPWTEANVPWSLHGKLRETPSLTTSIVVAHDEHASNPFLHTYHPDHDNLDASFTSVLPRGAESYTVRRDIVLNVAPPTNDFAALTEAAQNIAGEYLETITVSGTGTNARQFAVRGTFNLKQLSPVPTLTLAP